MFKILRKIRFLFFVLIIFLFFIFLFSRGHIYSPAELKYGVTFSVKEARDLNLDWQKMFLAILDDLGARRLRLAAYWDEIESRPEKFKWEDLDWQIGQAGDRKAKIILAVGGRLPRWPECHFPSWAEKLPNTEREEKILNYIKKTIERYKDNKNIIAWQVENEPFLSHFGHCPELNKKFLDTEIALVRSLDSRPIVVTDSGELSIWIPAARRADIFGTTMYRDTYSHILKRYIHYPIGPNFFHFKRNITRLFAHPKKWIVIELQAEPWGPRPWQELTQDERNRTMNLEKFKEIIKFSRLAGFREFYLWGAEWWYWEREVNHNPALWKEARRLFRKNYGL